MNKIIQKILSLILLILITLLTFDYFKVISFTPILKNSFAFIILVCAIISAMGVILCSSSKAFKFINYLIILSLIFGGVLLIVQSKLNFIVLAFIVFTVSYALINMIYGGN